MRKIFYPYESSNATLCDRYNNKRGSFKLKYGENTLSECESGEFYRDDFGNVFSVVAGEGVQAWEDCLGLWDFSHLKPNVLSTYLASFSLNFSDSLDSFLITQWLEVYDKNIQKGAEYLLPPNFKQLEISVCCDGI